MLQNSVDLFVYLNIMVSILCFDGYVDNHQVEVANGSCTQSSPKSWVRFVSEKHVLMLHAGGDSKRVPWANPMGKVFLPLPYLAADDPDGPVPLLFDHVLAIASCARQAFKDEGEFPYFSAM